MDSLFGTNSDWMGSFVLLDFPVEIETKDWNSSRRYRWPVAWRGRRSRRTTTTLNAVTGRSRGLNMACPSPEQIRIRTTLRVNCNLSPTRGTLINAKEI